MYFITVCVHERECLFGSICDGEMTLNEAGRMAGAVWQKMPERFPNAMLDEFRIMPNHFHGIICITDGVGAPLAAPGFDSHEFNKGAASSAPTIGKNQGAASSAPTLGKIMRAFKSISAIEANHILDRQGQPLWQRNYYERIIRDDGELTNIREYIADNPAKWAEDKENPDSA